MIAADGARARDLFPRRIFCVGCDSVLKVENESVRSKCARFLKRTRVGARRTKDGAARTQRSWHAYGFLLDADWRESILKNRWMGRCRIQRLLVAPT